MAGKAITKILIIRLSSIGDIILTTPVIRILKQTFPAAEIDFVIKKEFAEVLLNHPLINHLYIFDKNKHRDLKKIRQEIQQQRYDLIVDLHKNFRSIYLSSLNRAKHVVRYKKYVLRRWCLVKFKLKSFRQIVPIYKRYLDALKSYQIQYDDLGPEIYFNEKTRQRIEKNYADFLNKNHGLILGIAPGASFVTKRWTASGFQTVINHYVGQNNIGIILFGNVSDRELIDSLNIKHSRNVLNVAGELSLSETGALMDHCDLVLTNDSGLMHLAAALKKKVVAIFGSTTEELGFFPTTTEHIIIQNKNLPCRPCSHIGRNECPKKHFKCMTEISPEQVIQAVDNLIE